jgi:hypothetical protein
VPARSAKPVSQASVRTHRPVSGSLAHRGRPRLVSSIPSARVAAGSANSRAASSMTAACAVGHDTPNAHATSATLRHASPTADPAARRSRPVVRRRAGTSGTDSVNDNRPHNASAQRHRRLCHTIDIEPSPYGRSRGAVLTRPFTDLDSTPQLGHPAAVSSSVCTCTVRPPNWSRSTRPTRNPGSPNNSVVSSFKPAASLG